MVLCKSLWKGCRELADKRRNRGGKGLAEPNHANRSKLLQMRIVTQDMVFFLARTTRCCGPSIDIEGVRA